MGPNGLCLNMSRKYRTIIHSDDKQNQKTKAGFLFLASMIYNRIECISSNNGSIFAC